MQFSPASIQSIKSISQRALTLYWNRLARGRSFPSIAEFDPEPRLHDPKQLVIWTIEDAFGQRRFRALYQGTNVAEVFNASWAGRTMDEVVPVPLKSMSIDGTNECAASGCAIYTVFATFDANGHRVDCERLLLPLGEGSTVHQIVAPFRSIRTLGVAGGRASAQWLTWTLTSSCAWRLSIMSECLASRVYSRRKSCRTSENARGQSGV